MGRSENLKSVLRMYYAYCDKYDRPPTHWGFVRNYVMQALNVTEKTADEYVNTLLTQEPFEEMGERLVPKSSPRPAFTWGKKE